MKTGIEFAHKSINFMAGCSRRSPGCLHCWAVPMAHRHGGNPKLPQYHGLTANTGHGPDWTGEVRWLPGVAERKIVELALAKKPLRIVYNLMSDMAHENAPDFALARTLAFFAALPQHKHIIITKRPHILAERIAQLAPCGQPDRDRWDAARRPLYDACNAASRERFRTDRNSKAGLALLHKAEWIGKFAGEDRFPLKNVMLMATVEDQERLEERAPHMLALVLLGWHVGFIHEPLLEPLDWSVDHDLPVLGTQWGPEWIVVGHEQGPGARTTYSQRSHVLARQCMDAGVPFFFKKDSWGGNPCNLPRQFPAWMEV